MDDISPEMAEAAKRQIRGASIAWGHGEVYDFAAPNPWVITLEDAAYALAYTVRWRGQARSDGRRCFFGVGQHCIYGAEEMLAAGHGVTNALAFLWHEPDEVVLPDMPGPVKPLLPGWRELALRNGSALLDRFQIPEPLDRDLMKRWDLRMMVTEKRDLMPGHERDRLHSSSHTPIPELEFPAFDRRIIPYPHPDEAAARFLELHHYLVHDRNTHALPGAGA